MCVFVLGGRSGQGATGSLLKPTKRITICNVVWVGGWGGGGGLVCFVFLSEDTIKLVVGHLLMVQWVIGLIPHGEPIELFLVSTSATRLV